MIAIGVFVFQFLSRNSVRWDERGETNEADAAILVSIPQSEFCPLGRAQGFAILVRCTARVSIPQSEFCPLGRCAGMSPCFSVEDGVSIPQSEFCPLGPGWRPGATRPARRFQFLSRNSVRWDCWPHFPMRTSNLGFQFLSRNSVRWDM